MKLVLKDLKKLGKMQRKFHQIKQIYLKMHIHLQMMLLWESKLNIEIFQFCLINF
jgi:hypothetical protein